MPVAAKKADGVLMLRRYFPILSWGAEYTRLTFDALAAASISGKRAAEGVMSVAA
jgi:hypothetical protein